MAGSSRVLFPGLSIVTLVEWRESCDEADWGETGAYNRKSPSPPRPFSFLFLAASETNEQASLEAV